MINIETLTQEERQFITGIINRLDSGDAKGIGTELLGDFMQALTPEVLKQGYRLGDVLCQGEGAEAFNEALSLENKSPLHLICAGYAMALATKRGGL
jgi:hypothetical protein